MIFLVDFSDSFIFNVSLKFNCLTPPESYIYRNYNFHKPAIPAGIEYKKELQVK